MTGLFASETTVIHHLRLNAGPASRLDPQAARLRAGFALDTADLRPPGLPPAAVLCVRRLRDPRPGGLDLSRPGAAAPPEWQRAVQEALARLAASAARPAREAVPAGAEAVLFADQGELLTCLARDWLEGALPVQWWWQPLMRGLDADRLVIKAWVEAPAYVPAALEGLAGFGLSAAFAARLDESAARRILGAVLAQFGLSAVERALDANWPAISGAPWQPAAPWEPYAPEARAVRTAAGRADGPSNAGAQLPRPQTALLGIGLTLRRAPQSARTEAFTEGVRAWAAGEPALAAPRPKSGTATQVQPVSKPAGDIPEQITSERTRAERPPEPAGHSTLEQEPPPPAPGADEAPPAVSASAETPAVLESTPASPAEAAAERPSTVEETAENEWPEALPGAWFDTAYGGLFYLINLGLFLGLYGDFTTPAAPGIDLPIWDFLAILSAAMTHDRPAMTADPVWDWLARLSGRPPGDAPGQRFRPPAEWRNPAEWLAPFGAPPPGTDAPWHWSADEGRLRVRHPAGFLVLDIEAGADPVDQLAEEIRPYAAWAGEMSPGAADPSASPDWIADPALAQWAGWLAEYAATRLTLALGLGPGADLAHSLLAHPARVYLTDTHLDVTYSLNHLPVEIRLAGLDRNPGWVPAAGRYVMFYYED